MRISPLPETTRYVLAEHHEGEGDQRVPLADAPAFVYKPLNPRDRSRWMAKLFTDEEQSSNEPYLDLFEERLVTVENLWVGDDPFDKAAHVVHLPLDWQLEVAFRIIAQSRLSDDDAGK